MRTSFSTNNSVGLFCEAGEEFSSLSTGCIEPLTVERKCPGCQTVPLKVRAHLMVHAIGQEPHARACQ